MQLTSILLTSVLSLSVVSIGACSSANSDNNLASQQKEQLTPKTMDSEQDVMVQAQSALPDLEIGE